MIQHDDIHPTKFSNKNFSKLLNPMNSLILGQDQLNANPALLASPSRQKKDQKAEKPATDESQPKRPDDGNEKDENREQRAGADEPQENKENKEPAAKEKKAEEQSPAADASPMKRDNKGHLAEKAMPERLNQQAEGQNDATLLRSAGWF
jgi:hypothetical protein